MKKLIVLLFGCLMIPNLSANEAKEDSLWPTWVRSYFLEDPEAREWAGRIADNHFLSESIESRVALAASVAKRTVETAGCALMLGLATQYGASTIMQGAQAALLYPDNCS